jgi:hypothetical protein
MEEKKGNLDRLDCTGWWRKGKELALFLFLFFFGFLIVRAGRG